MSVARIKGVEVLVDAGSVLVGALKLNLEAPIQAVVDGGDPEQVNVSLGGSTPVIPFIAEATNIVVVATDVFDPLPGMLITPGEGTYTVLFSTSASCNKNSKFAIFSVFVNGVAVAESERDAGGQANNRGGVMCMAFNAVVADGQDIEIRWRVNTVSGGPVATCIERQLMLIRAA